MPLLSAKPFHFGDRHALDADFTQPIPDLIKLKWLNDGFDHFHSLPSWRCRLPAQRRHALDLRSCARE
jgi:hypothetical protein